jgi:hypothetical protein
MGRELTWHKQGPGFQPQNSTKKKKKNPTKKQYKIKSRKIQTQKANLS